MILEQLKGDILMRLGWTNNNGAYTYRAIKTVRNKGVDGNPVKNRSVTVKKFGTDKYIRETYGVTDAKAWAKEHFKEMFDGINRSINEPS